MGTLAWFAIGFCAACTACVYGKPGIWLFPLGLFCLAALLATLCVKSKTGKIWTKILLGCFAGILWLGVFDGVYLRPALKLDGSTQTLQVELTDYSYETEYGTAAEGRVRLDGWSYRVKVYLKEERILSPGDTVTGDFLLRYTAGGSRLPTFHQGRGIFLLGYPRSEGSVEIAQRTPVRYYPVVYRERITALMNRLFPEDTIGFARALLLGDDTLLSHETDMALQISGIRHIIAVSGLHVSILFGTVYLLCGKRRILTAVLGIPVLLTFAAIAGFTPSIVRACVMQCLMILAMLLNREYDPPSALAFAVLTMLAVNPFTVTSVSFQLSVASIIGIFLFCTNLQQYFMGLGRIPKGKLAKRLKTWVVASVAVTLSAMVTTVPLCAWYFGMVSTVSVLTNLLTLWVVTAVFCGIMFACLLGAIWLPLGQGIAWIISWPMRYVLMIADFFSKLPYSAVYTSSVYIVAWLIFSYVLFMVFMRHRKKHPGLFAGCIVLGLVAAICCTALETKPEGFAVTVIDVGQGQCVLLQTQEEAYLVDCGNTQGEDAASVAIPELLTRGITRLDGLIVTHYDKDHAAAVNALLNWIPADNLYLPDATPENELRGQIVAENSDIIQWVLEETRLSVQDGTLTIYPSSQTDEANESSLCILFQVENYDILITGDRSIAGEEELLATADLPELELLVAGHHGSGSSTGLALLAETKPTTVVISVGEDNSYGHPHPDALTRLELFGCKVLRTDQMGTITFRR